MQYGERVDFPFAQFSEVVSALLERGEQADSAGAVQVSAAVKADIALRKGPVVHVLISYV